VPTFHAIALTTLLLQAAQEQQASTDSRIKEWESEHRVLGHNSKSDVNRPKALLSIVNSIRNKDESGGSASEGSGPFETHLWRARG
jgi:hypothetical protein